MSKRKKVVVVGAGFGGLALASNLANTKFDVTIIDRTNHHLFQPLLYQVASAALSPGDIASPIRSILRNARNVKVEFDEVTEIDLDSQRIRLAEQGLYTFDYLVLAPGTRHSYFGNDHWEQHAPGLKSLKDALQIRERLLVSFELAEHAVRVGAAKPNLTFVVVGAGPTGVEVAGALCEIGRKTMVMDFPRLDPDDIRVILVEAGPRVLSAFPEVLSARAARDLEEIGVELMLNTRVVGVSDGLVTLALGDAVIDIQTNNVVWAAGNQAPEFLKTMGVPQDGAGRVIVNADCSVGTNRNVFVIGDAAAFHSGGSTLPGLAQVAMQQGAFVAKLIRSQSAARRTFSYADRGTMATIGRARAVGVVGGIKLSGVVCWILWALVHVASLIGFRNRLRVMFEWFWYYVTFKPGARLIVQRGFHEQQPGVHKHVH